MINEEETKTLENALTECIKTCNHYEFWNFMMDDAKYALEHMKFFDYSDESIDTAIGALTEAKQLHERKQKLSELLIEALFEIKDSRRSNDDHEN
jgi:hypothetical protein